MNHHYSHCALGVCPRDAHDECAQICYAALATMHEGYDQGYDEDEDWRR